MGCDKDFMNADTNSLIKLMLAVIGSYQDISIFPQCRGMFWSSTPLKLVSCPRYSWQNA